MDDGVLHRKLVWLAFFRLVMVTVLLGGTALMSWGGSDAETSAATALYWLVGVTYACSAALAVALRERWRPRAVAYAQLALDAATAGAVVLLTGRSDSVFVFLFSIAIVNGAIAPILMFFIFKIGSITLLAIVGAALIRSVTEE